MADGELSHVDRAGAARMIDVGDKAVTERNAVARAVCRMKLPTAEAIRDNSSKKGDVLQVARLAAIGAAKRTDELIPLCHTLPLDSVQVDFAWIEPTRLQIDVATRSTGKTGVEMEAMVGASIAAMTVYDMCKSSDREMTVEQIELIRKSGGVHGLFERKPRNP